MVTTGFDRNRTLFLTGLIVMACVLAVPRQGHAQDRSPRFGFGLDVTMGAPDNSVIGSTVALGFRGRVSYPISYDVSLAAGAGLNGGFQDGCSNAAVTFTPQVSAIVTIPDDPWAPYFLAGFGGFIPFSSRAEGGPSLHAGVGWARLLTDASIYLEIDPQLVVGESSSRVVLPLRAGVIF